MGSVLDFGCGTGVSAELFLKCLGVQRFTGVDVSEKSLAVAQKAHGGEGKEFTLIQNYAPRAEFDLAFCNGVFHHIPPPERPESAEYVFRALKPGGLFAVFENNPWNPGARLVMRRIAFDRDAIRLWPSESRRLLRNAGFTILLTDSLFYFPRAFAWLRGLEPMLAALPFGAQYLVLARKS